MFSAIKSFFIPEPATLKSGTKVSSLDIVMYAAELVSNPQAVEPISDQIREVTATINPENPTTTVEQEEKLKKAYLDLEAYLITNEPAQKFTKESLRARISQKLHLETSQATFWQSITNL